MYIAVFAVMAMFVPFDFWVQNLKVPIRLLFADQKYEFCAESEEYDEGGNRSCDSVCSSLALAPLERFCLGGYEGYSRKGTPAGEIETKRTVSYYFTRLPFDLFLARFQLEEHTNETGSKPSPPVRLTSIRIVPLGRFVHIDLGEDVRTGKKRTWEVSVKKEKR